MFVYFSLLFVCGYETGNDLLAVSVDTTVYVFRPTTAAASSQTLVERRFTAEV